MFLSKRRRLLQAASESASPQDTVLAGTAEARIDLPVGTPLGGYTARMKALVDRLPMIAGVHMPKPSFRRQVCRRLRCCVRCIGGNRAHDLAESRLVSRLIGWCSIWKLRLRKAGMKNARSRDRNEQSYPPDRERFKERSTVARLRSVSGSAVSAAA